MKENIAPAIRLTLVCAVFFSGIYTLALLGIAQFAPNQGKGVLVSQDGKSYHVNVAQKFTEDKYFQSRPSAVDYNAAGSGGSNKGPSNPDYLSQVQARIDTFLVHNPGVAKTEIPSELVTASGSGLDPDISPKAAMVQVKRITSVRKISQEKVQNIISENTQAPFLGMFGPQKVNVLKLNLALEKL